VCIVLLQKKGALAEHRAAVVLFEVLKVVAACHRRSVCHGDIKVWFAARRHVSVMFFDVYGNNCFAIG
jgi:serine/threonine protein kinase